MNGSLIARYKYDAWGNTLSIVDANGNEITSSTALPVQNPFRYRGYYFDSESGLYYLQSRYYDPVTCRFINADTYITECKGILGFNVFAYCGNNPVNNVDYNGHLFEVIFVVGVFVVGMIVTFTGCSSKPDPAPKGNDPDENSPEEKSYNSEVVCEIIDKIDENTVINSGFGLGYGGSLDFGNYAGISGEFYCNPINVQISNNDIKFYASAYIGASISQFEVETAIEKYIVFDWETGQFYDVGEDEIIRFSEPEFGISAYKGIGAKISVGFNELY